MSHLATPVPLNLVKPSAPMRARVVENRDLCPDSVHDVQHLVIDLGDSGFHYLEGQSVGVIVPGTDANGKPHRLRLYSIASARQGDDGQGRSVSLCIKRVEFQNEAGETVLGLCSNHTYALKPGDEVLLCGPIGKHFLLPEAPKADLICFATGTGIAPFRAFYQRVQHDPQALGGDFFGLVFGFRKGCDFLYEAELKAFFQGPTRPLLTARSEEETGADGGPLFVGEKVAELESQLWPRLMGGSLHVMMCGLRAMEQNVDAAFRAMAERHGQDWAVLKPQLVAEKRWLVDTY